MQELSESEHVTPFLVKSARGALEAWCALLPLRLVRDEAVAMGLHQHIVHILSCCSTLDERLVEQGCRALWNVLVDTTCGDAVVEMNGVQVLMTVLGLHEANPAVLKHALWASSNLIAACDHPIALEQALAMNGVQLTLALLHRHMSDASVLEEALALTCCFAGSRDGKQVTPAMNTV